MPFVIDGYEFPDGEEPARGPIAALTPKRWTEQDVLGGAGQPTILTFIGTRSQKWTYVSRATTATKDKLVAVDNAAISVLFKTPQDAVGFSVVMTRLEIAYAEPLANNKWLCEFDLVKR